MKKLCLDPETLRVDSFDVDGGDDLRGTVVGHLSRWCSAQGITCDGVNNTCNNAVTCGNAETCLLYTCGAECGGTYGCGATGSCGQMSCIQTCLVTCAPC